MMISGPNKKEVNFELNLLPVFDVLSACTCFLLMTAVWIHLGSIDANQALGGQSIAETKNPPSVWVYMNKSGQLTLKLKDADKAPAQLKEITLKGTGGAIEWKSLSRYVSNLQARYPLIQTALIMPSENSRYDDIVRLMDQFRGGGIRNIGISPL